MYGVSPANDLIYCYLVLALWDFAHLFVDFSTIKLGEQKPNVAIYRKGHKKKRKPLCSLQLNPREAEQL